MYSRQQHPKDNRLDRSSTLGSAREARALNEVTEECKLSFHLTWTPTRRFCIRYRSTSDVVEAMPRIHFTVAEDLFSQDISIMTVKIPASCGSHSISAKNHVGVLIVTVKVIWRNRYSLGLWELGLIQYDDGMTDVL